MSDVREFYKDDEKRKNYGIVAMKSIDSKKEIDVYFYNTIYIMPNLFDIFSKIVFQSLDIIMENKLSPSHNFTLAVIKNAFRGLTTCGLQPFSFHLGKFEKYADAVYDKISDNKDLIDLLFHSLHEDYTIHAKWKLRHKSDEWVTQYLRHCKISKIVSLLCPYYSLYHSILHKIFKLLKDKSDFYTYFIYKMILANKLNVLYDLNQIKQLYKVPNISNFITPLNVAGNQDIKYLDLLSRISNTTLPWLNGLGFYIAIIMKEKIQFDITEEDNKYILSFKHRYDFKIDFEKYKDNIAYLKGTKSILKIATKYTIQYSFELPKEKETKVLIIREGKTQIPCINDQLSEIDYWNIKTHKLIDSINCPNLIFLKSGEEYVRILILENISNQTFSLQLSKNQNKEMYFTFHYTHRDICYTRPSGIIEGEMKFNSKYTMHENPVKEFFNKLMQNKQESNVDIITLPNCLL